MAKYRISGIWKNDKDEITHYGLHKVVPGGTTRVDKIAKSEAVELLSKPENSAVVWVWDYSTANWRKEEDIHIVHTSNGSYLRSNPDHEKTDNIANLIDYNWVREN